MDDKETKTKPEAETKEEKQSKEDTPPPAITQADLDKAVEAAVAKAKSDAQAEFGAAFREATGAESLEAYKTAKLEEEGKHQEAAKLAQEGQAKAETRVKELLGETAVTAIAAELKAINPADVYALVRGQIQVDDKEAVTIAGQEPKAYLETYLKDKAYLVAPSGKGGSDSRPGGAPSEEITAEEHLAGQFNK